MTLTLNLNLNWPSLAAVVAGLAELREIVMANQTKIQEIADAIGAATEGIRGDIAALKAAVENGEPLDWGPLDAKVAALAALDAENPPPVMP